MKVQYAVAHCACGSGLLKPSTAAAGGGGGGSFRTLKYAFDIL